MSLSWNIFSSWGRVLFALVYFYLSNFWEFAFWLLMSCSPGWGMFSVSWHVWEFGSCESWVRNRSEGFWRHQGLPVSPLTLSFCYSASAPLASLMASCLCSAFRCPPGQHQPSRVLFLCLEALCLPLTLPTLQGGAVLRKAFPPWVTHSSPCPPRSRVPARIAPSGLHEHHHCCLPYLKQPHRW